MRARQGMTVAGVAAALVLVGGPAWADDPEPLPDGCSYVDAPTTDPSDPAEPPSDEGTAEPADPGDTGASAEPDPGATEQPPVEATAEPPAEPEPTGDPGLEPEPVPVTSGDGQVVVCIAAAQPGGFTGGGGGLETADTGSAAAELPRTGSSTGAAALLGLSLVVGGVAVVLSARAPRRT